MNETKFTPGPWEIRESATQIGRCFRVSTRQVLDGNHGAALLYDDSTSLNPHGDGVQKANARLIAAAPDGYALAEEVANRLYTPQDIARVRQMAKDFIAKVAGR